MLDRVGERLAGDEVGDRLDLRRRAVAARLQLDRHRRAAREVLERGREALVEPRRAHAGGDRPQVGDRRRDLVDGGVERGREDLRLAGQRALQPPQHDAERDEPLLRAVVQVALEPAALGVAGLRDPRARRLDLGELQPQLDPQAAELDRDRRGVEHRVQQVRPLRERRVVEQHADLAAVAADRRARAAVVGQRVEQVAAAVGVGAGLGQAEDDLGARVVERERERRADVLRLRCCPSRTSSRKSRSSRTPSTRCAGEAPVDDRLQAVAQRAERERRGERAEPTRRTPSRRPAARRAAPTSA